MLKHIVTVSTLAGIIGLSSIGMACSLAGHQQLNVDQTLPAIVFDDFEASVQSIKRGSNSVLVVTTWVG